MDTDIKNRVQTKGGKKNKQREPYNQKSIRIKEQIRTSQPKNNKKKLK